MFLFDVGKDERPEKPEADVDYVPFTTKPVTSWSDDSELSDVVED